jgi:DNA mismatch repair protein MutS2
VVKFSAPAQIDIRGMRVAEAINLLDKQISESITSNVPELTVLHGKGTGALRLAIKEYLDTNHSITSFREGKLVEGGAGVTIINL